MPSRRRILRTGSAAALLPLAGCAGTANGGPESGTPPGIGAGTDTDSDGITPDRSTGIPPGETAVTATGTTGSVDDPGETLLAVMDGDGEIELVTYGDVASVGEVRESTRRGGYVIPIQLTDAGVESFVDGLAAAGAFAAPEEHEIRTYLDGEVIFSATLAPGLAESIEAGEWDGRFVLTTQSRERADRLRDRLSG